MVVLAPFLVLALIVGLVLWIAWARGIRGWLLIPAVGITFAPLQIGASIAGLLDLQKFVPDGHVAQTLIWVDVAILAAFLVGSLLIIVRLYGKSRSFPRSYVMFSVAAISFVILDNIAWVAIVGLDVVEGLYLVQIAAASAIGVAWIFYMQQSLRVRETFVN